MSPLGVVLFCTGLFMMGYGVYYLFHRIPDPIGEDEEDEY